MQAAEQVSIIDRPPTAPRRRLGDQRKGIHVTALYIIPILAVLILVHEFGHFITARLVGIRVEEFGIGLPPRLFGIRRGNMIYSINLLPIGGFVRVLGEDGTSQEPDSLQSKSKLQRALFMSAGAIMNVLLALILTTVLVAAQGEPATNVYVADVEPGSPAATAGWEKADRVISVDGEEIDNVDELIAKTNEHAGTPMAVTILRAGQPIDTTVVPRADPPEGSGPTGIRVTEAPVATLTATAVEDGSPAAQAGFRSGDVIREIGGQPVEDASAFTLMVEKHAGQTVPVGVERDGATQSLSLAVPNATPAQSTIDIGITLSQDVIYQSIPWWQIIPRGVQQTVAMVGDMIQGFVMLVRGDIPTGSGIAGPIGMGQLTSEILEVSTAPAWVTLTNLTVLLSLNLAILNMLPIPALDGGRLLFVVIEAIRGRRVSPEREGMVHFIGLVVLLAFMAVVAFADIDRLMSGQSLLQ